MEFIPIALPDLSDLERSYLIDAYDSTWISSKGAYIDRLESSFAEFCGIEHGVAVSNGTVALHLALDVLGIGPGDEVIVPDLTFAATINSVLYTGATPVIVDVSEEDWCLDPAKTEAAITERTKAIIPVHLYGQPADMGPFMDLKKKYGVYIIEDAAEAHGATYHGKTVGGIGDINTFSFYGNKIITTGEGGICLTNNAEWADKMRTLRDHGMNKEKRYWHDFVGYNYRMTNLQAAIGCAQVERAEEMIGKKVSIESQYRQALKDISFVEFQRNFSPDREKVNWLTSILINENKRDEVIGQLKKFKIDYRYFFYTLSSMPLYQPYVADPCDVSTSLSARGLSLPTHMDIDFDRIRKAFESVG